VGPVGFEASVRVPLLVGFMVHYTSRYKIILSDKVKQYLLLLLLN
jgi:hypothetical protein